MRLRILFVVQRYGAEVAGGAEAHCRNFADRLAARGHQVEVLTTCAIGYLDWAIHYPPGPSVDGGVTVHRLAVRAPRDMAIFGPINGRVASGRAARPLWLQKAWMSAQGPDVPQIGQWLEENAGRFDVAVFFTYLYETTYAGLPVATRLLPTVLHPTAHDEPPFWLELFDPILRMPSGFAFSTPEEQELVERRCDPGRPSKVIGIGIDLVPGLGSVAEFRERFGLSDRPYLVYVGRVDPHKGTDELYRYFTEYKRRFPGPLALVIVGEEVHQLPDSPDVVKTGFVDEETRRAAVRGSVSLVQPSYFESFSMVLAEAWSESRPAIVQGSCSVLDGQVRRARGGLAYRDYPEFEVAVGALADNPGLADHLGATGRLFVESNYHWDVVLNRYEDLLWQVSTGVLGRSGHLGRGRSSA